MTRQEIIDYCLTLPTAYEEHRQGIEINVALLKELSK